MSIPECDECRAIIADYVAANKALAQEMLDSTLGSDEEFARALLQARMLKTEEDVASAEELFPAVQFSASPGVGLAVRRMLVHEIRTGHQIRRAFRQK